MRKLILIEIFNNRKEVVQCLIVLRFLTIRIWIVASQGLALADVTHFGPSLGPFLTMEGSP